MTQLGSEDDEIVFLAERRLGFAELLNLDTQAGYQAFSELKHVSITASVSRSLDNVRRAARNRLTSFRGGATPIWSSRFANASTFLTLFRPSCT